MRIVFIGASRFGLRCLEAAHGMPSIDIAGIITNEATFSISYAPEGVVNILHADMPSYARAHSIPCYVMQDKMGEPPLAEHVRNWQPDLFLVVGWYHLVPKSLRDLAPAIGMHASLLPDYSGGAPLVWAIINGETRTGITLFQLEDGVDDGPILGQKATPITPDDTISTLYARIEGLGLELLGHHLPKLANGTAQFTPQSETARRRFPNRNPADGLIDWQHPAHRIYDFIRAQTRPYPGAFTLYRDEKLHIWSAQAVNGQAGIPGTLIFTAPSTVTISCGNGSHLLLGTVGWHGADMAAHEWVNTMQLDGEPVTMLG